FSRDWSSDVCSSDLHGKVYRIQPGEKVDVFIGVVGAQIQFLLELLQHCHRFQVILEQQQVSGAAGAGQQGGDIEAGRVDFRRLRSEERRVGKCVEKW